jgi:glycosyltransferase involved in cell wall biosynthesis
LRILQVHTRHRHRGGEDNVVEREQALLSAQGHDVCLFEGRNSPRASKAAGQLVGSIWNPRAAGALEDAIGSFSPDVVHLHNTWYAMSPAVAVRASRLGAPVVMTLHNFRLACVNGLLYRDGALCEDCVGHGPWRGVAHRCYRGSVGASAAAATQLAIHRQARTWPRSVDVFLALSEFAARRHAAAEIPPQRIFVKYNFVDDPGPRDRLPSRSDEILFVGRDSPEKGLDRLLASWTVAAPRGLRLTVIGPIDQDSTGLSDPSVTFAGPLPADRVMSRMRQARALVVPSRCPEGPSLAVFEALAAGLPVVGSALGGIDELLSSLEHSTAVADDDEVGWIAALGALIDGDLVDRGGAEARSLYEERFAPRHAVAALSEAYERAIERRDRSPGRLAAAEARSQLPSAL